MIYLSSRMESGIRMAVRLDDVFAYMLGLNVAVIRLCLHLYYNEVDSIRGNGSVIVNKSNKLHVMTHSLEDLPG